MFLSCTDGRLRPFVVPVVSHGLGGPCAGFKGFGQKFFKSMLFC